MKLFKELDKNKGNKLENVEFMSKIQGTGGIILNLKSKKRKFVYFIAAHQKDQYYLFEFKKNEVRLI